MGSDPLSCHFLNALADCPDIEVVLVITQPDRGKGRHLRVVPGPVKELALSRDIPVITPVNVNAPFVMETLAGLGIDAIVVMAYGQFLREALLELPPLGCINLHVSLLPRWRGAAPIQRAILANDAETGVTAMMMDRGMDTGDILGTVRCPIEPKDTTASIGAKLSKSGCELAIEVLHQLSNGTCPRKPQPREGVTMAPKILNEEASLDFSLSAIENERKVRALYPKPGAGTWIPVPGMKNPNGLPDGMLLKVLSANVETLPKGMALAMAGTLLELNQKSGPLIAGGAGKALRLTQVQPQGGKPMPGSSFANGYRSKIPIGIRCEKIPVVDKSLR